MGEVLTAADVRAATFSSPRIGKRGYNSDGVDNFLDEVVAALEGHRQLSAADVAGAEFGKPPWGKRGYNEDDVDALLDRIVATFERRGGSAQR